MVSAQELEKKKYLTPQFANPTTQAQYAVGPSAMNVPKVTGVSANTTQNTPIPAYGSNVANFDPNNSAHKALADAGQAYATAKASGDTAGMAAAAARGNEIRSGIGIPSAYDSKKGVTTFGTPQVASTGVTPQVDYNALAAAEQARYLAERQRIADQQKAGLTSAWNRSNEILKGNRALEDYQVNAVLSPFNGHTSFAKGLTARERTLADESAQGQYNSAIQGVEQGLADDRNTAAQAIMARAYQLEQDAKNFDLNYAGVYGQGQNGQRTLAAQQFDWTRDPNNPANVGQNLTNEINRLKLQNLPQEMKLGLESLENEVATGKLNRQEAELKLKELQDPNSITNQSMKLELEAKRLGNEELRKKIAEIGKKPAMTAEEKRMKEIALQKAEIELKNLQDGSGKKDSFKLDDYKSYINNTFSHYNPSNGTRTFDSAAARTYILSLFPDGKDDDKTDALLKYFGMPTN